MALVLVQILSGINTPLIKSAVTKISPFMFGFLRVGISFAIMLPIYFLIRKGKKKKRKAIKRKDLWMAALGTFLIYGVANLAFYAGIKHTTSINASIIILLWPIIFFLANVEVLKERFSTRAFLGILLAFIGAIIAVGWPLAGSFSPALLTTTGTLLIFVCVLVDVIGTLILKRVLQRVDTFTVLTIGLGIATAFYAILALPYASQIQLLSDPTVRGAVLYGSIMVGCIGYSLGYYALRIAKGGDYSVVSYLQPIVGIIAATIILHERFTPSLLLGTMAVFGGLYLVEARHLSHGHVHGTHR